MLLKRSFQENIPRLLAASGTRSKPTAPDVRDALLGGVDVALPPLRKVWEEFSELTKTKRLRKSDRQKHLWALPRARAVANFEKAVPKRAKASIDRIDREDVLAFRTGGQVRSTRARPKRKPPTKTLGILRRL